MAGTTRRIEEKYGLAVPEAFSQIGLGHLDVDMSMTAVAAAGGYVVQPGDISVRDVYSLYRFSNNLLALAMTGAQIRAVMEENASDRLTARFHDGEAFVYAQGDQFTDAGGLYLVSGTKGSLAIQPMPQNESLSRWRLEPACGGWYLVNAGAAGQSAIQYYSGRFTMYHLGKSGSYVFNVYEVQ